MLFYVSMISPRCIIPNTCSCWKCFVVKVSCCPPCTMVLLYEIIRCKTMNGRHLWPFHWHHLSNTNAPDKPEKRLLYVSIPKSTHWQCQDAFVVQIWKYWHQSVRTSSKWSKVLFLSSIWHWRSRSVAPQNNRDLNQGLLHFRSKFRDPSLKFWWVIAQTSSWLTDTDTNAHTQAMTRPEGHNWPREKKASCW